MLTDTIKGLGVYELISKTGLCVTVALCYRFKPTKLFMATQFGRNALQYSTTHFPTPINFIQNSAKTFANWLTSNKYISKIPQTFQLKAERFSKAVVESSLIYHAMIPIYGWLTYKVIKTSSNSDNKKKHVKMFIAR